MKIETFPISNRLKMIATYLAKGTVFADIGSDHAYLPCYVCLTDPTANAIVGEVNQGPYNRASETVKTYGLAHAIDVRLGNGLEVITENDGVFEITIAGMGGTLIKQILFDGCQKLKTVKRIIVQPNIDERDARLAFVQLGYKITDEVIIEENGHIYEIIVGDRQPSDQLTDKELMFGPILLKNRNELFIKKWRSEYNNRLRIVNQMKEAKLPNVLKIQQYELQLLWIKEVINHV